MSQHLLERAAAGVCCAQTWVLTSPCVCVKIVCAAVIGLIADDSLHMTHLQAYLKKLGYSTHMVRARAEDLECDFGDQPQENSIMFVIRNRRYDADSSVISTATLASQWQTESSLLPSSVVPGHVISYQNVRDACASFLSNRRLVLFLRSPPASRAAAHPREQPSRCGWQLETLHGVSFHVPR